jgi:hypothetical protein
MTVESIARVIVLVVYGERWFNHHVDYTDLKYQFCIGTNDQLHRGPKGILRSSLVEPWRHVSMCVQTVFTYEGDISYFMATILDYWLRSLELMSSKAQENHNPVTSITHPGLVKLLVCDAFSAIGRNWDSFFSQEHS